MSQLDLAAEADVSTRHLSFLETGRAQPSRAMVLRLAERLELPLRERNRMLVAAGYAPNYPQRDLAEEPLAPVRSAVERLLQAHLPNPALAVDRHWTLLFANEAVPPLLDGAAPALLEPPVNVLRLSLHPEGLAPRIANLPEWRAHLLARLRREADQSGDPGLADLLEELRRFPAGGPARPPAPEEVAVPLRLRSAMGELCFLSTTMVFGTPVEVTVSELAIEAFLPADESTAEAMRRLVSAPA